MEPSKCIASFGNVACKVSDGLPFFNPTSRLPNDLIKDVETKKKREISSILLLPGNDTFDDWSHDHEDSYSEFLFRFNLRHTQLWQAVAIACCVHKHHQPHHRICSVIPIEPARKRIPHPKYLPHPQKVVTANSSDRGRHLSQHRALLCWTRWSRGRESPTLGPDGDRCRSLSIG